VTDIINYELKG